jgi:hypothetical protein
MPINDGWGGNLSDTFGSGNFGTPGGNPSTTPGGPSNPGGWGGGGYPGGYSGNWQGAGGGMGFGGTPPGYGPSMPYPGGYATPYLQSPLGPPPAPPQAPPGMGPYNIPPNFPISGDIGAVPPETTIGSLLGGLLNPTPPSTFQTDPYSNPPTFSPPNEETPWPGTGRTWDDPAAPNIQPAAGPPPGTVQDYGYPGMDNPFNLGGASGTGLLGMNNPVNYGWDGFSGLGQYAGGTTYGLKGNLQR